MGVHSKEFDVCQALIDVETRKGIAHIMRAEPADIDRQEQRIIGIIYGISQLGAALCKDSEKEALQKAKITATGVITVKADERRRRGDPAPEQEPAETGGEV